MAEFKDLAATDFKVGDRNKDVPWYLHDLEAIGPTARELLEKYSKILADGVVAHVLKIRDLAWQIFPYPCIGQFRFLDLSIAQQPFYPRLLSRLTSPSPPTFLDLGCCFGQDIRKLVHDGAPAAALSGAELRGAFLDMGYELFRDRETLGARFIEADVFAEGEADALARLDGTVDVVYTASFLHLFGLATQIRVAKRIVRLLRDEAGVVCFGRQVGTLKPDEDAHPTNEEGKMFRHDGQTFRRMWEQVGRETGTEWRVWAELETWEEWKKGRTAGWGNDEYTRRLRFEVERVK
ncbi:hypothetical protein MMC13_003056 [Lambiella insularis]|nr:hypothetical protein [Lambiella insularis]